MNFDRLIRRNKIRHTRVSKSELRKRRGESGLKLSTIGNFGL